LSGRLSFGMSRAGALFWDATKEKRLILQRCNDCDHAVFYPRDFCPRCFGEALSWNNADGSGSIYALSVMHKPGNPLMAPRLPYVVAIVELSEGVRLLSAIVGDGQTTAKIDDKVQISWEALGDGRNLPVFEVVKSTAS